MHARIEICMSHACIVLGCLVLRDVEDTAMRGRAVGSLIPETRMNFVGLVV